MASALKRRRPPMAPRPMQRRSGLRAILLVIAGSRRSATSSRASTPIGVHLRCRRPSRCAQLHPTVTALARHLGDCEDIERGNKRNFLCGP